MTGRYTTTACQASKVPNPMILCVIHEFIHPVIGDDIVRATSGHGSPFEALVKASFLCAGTQYARGLGVYELQIVPQTQTLGKHQSWSLFRSMIQVNIWTESPR